MAGLQLQVWLLGTAAGCGGVLFFFGGEMSFLVKTGVACVEAAALTMLGLSYLLAPKLKPKKRKVKDGKEGAEAIAEDSAEEVEVPKAGTEVFVMLPLDLFGEDNSLKDAEKLTYWLRKLRAGNVDGVMVDVWWGLVEKNAEEYDWSGYAELFKLVRVEGLKLEAIMSFHQCGGNVGDACNIPLPAWVLQLGITKPDCFYTDRQGVRNRECLSLGVDDVRLFYGRTALEMYRDYMASFRKTFAHLMGTTIVNVAVGAGPAGELRYPSYPLDRWEYPGVGEFQCYDKYMLGSLREAADAIETPQWSNGGPNNAGTYNSRPWDTEFFSEGGENFRSDYGKFFLGWYHGLLLKHADDLLRVAHEVFASEEGVSLSMKVAGIHWWHKVECHAAELTSGYYYADGENGYQNICNVLAKYDAAVCFTCLEMRDSEQGQECNSAPEHLVQVVKQAAVKAKIPFSGENALPRYDDTAYRMVEHQASTNGPTKTFTYLRMNPTLMQDDNLSRFKTFTENMHCLVPSVEAAAPA